MRLSRALETEESPQTSVDGDKHVEEVIALASDFSTASSTCEEALKRRPGETHHASAEGEGD
jgi:hypothetical protein